MHHEKIDCPDCGKSITKNNLKNHLNSSVCMNTKNGTLNKIIKIDESLKSQNQKYRCPHCNMEYSKKGIATHIWRMHGEGKYFTKNNDGFKTGRKSWNKGLSSLNDDRVKQNANSVSKTIQRQIMDGTYVPRIMGPEARKQLSLRQSLCNSGGKSKWFDVGGVSVQGTWERDCALKFNEFEIKWEKVKLSNTVRYVMSGKTKSYTPDIFLPELGITLEIKGYWWGNDKEKMKCVLTEHDYLGDKIYFVFEDDFKKIISSTTRSQVIENIQSLTSLRNYFR